MLVIFTIPHSPHSKASRGKNMPWPEIDEVELPNGRLITVCAPHQQVVCGRCCLDFSYDLESDYDEDDEDGEDDEMFGYDFDSVVPRDVTFGDVANSRYGRRHENEDNAVHALTAANVFGFSAGLFAHDVDPESAYEKEARDIGYRHSQTVSMMPQSARKRPIGNVFPTQFGDRSKFPVPPFELFPHSIGLRATPPVERYINRYDVTELLIYTDGACFDNGGVNARAGCSFVFKPAKSREETGRIAFRLEDRGPDGNVYKHTSNRAELRAAIAALRFRHWPGEGFRSIVIATDSTYVANGATVWVRAWMRKGWRLKSGEPVKSRDLWEALLLGIERLHEHGMAVRFWKIPRKWNQDADRAAKGAAAVLEATPNYTDIFGLLTR
ncbi:putative RNase H domain-containing protein [Colletotrichum karsti]|uniref:ribonuclease H n=1 Tax=Colletotrichum karsti TaxID=1095194 RepID=A0A9P6I4E4_9PEZI|nr:putative RNase H domain-containing protein [Colletotrichum karsti]KAF9875572.1 putative RNase H domain-containing protein [Colletotrichum karsti]